MPDTSGAPRRHESGRPDPQAAGILWLVRHGQSGWNVAGRIQGQSRAAPGLTATGREEAAQAAQELARRASRAPLIVASDLARTVETAQIIASHLGLPVEFDPGLREQSLGDLEGHSAFTTPDVKRTPGANGPIGKNTAGGAVEGGGAGGAAGRDAYVRDATEWAAEGEATGDVLDAYWEEPFRKPPGGESVAEMYDRVHRGLNRIAAAHPEDDLIIVTHGGPVRVATAGHPPKPGQAFPRAAIGNASVTPCRPPAPPSASVTRGRDRRSEGR